MGFTACTEPQSLYKGDLYLFLFCEDCNFLNLVTITFDMSAIMQEW